MSLDNIFMDGATSDEIATLEAAETAKHNASGVVYELTADLDDAVRKLVSLRQELDRAHAKQEKADRRLCELEIEIGRRINERKAKDPAS